jgi:hypothetical protein
VTNEIMRRHWSIDPLRPVVATAVAMARAMALLSSATAFGGLVGLALTTSAYGTPRRDAPDFVTPRRIEDPAALVRMLYSDEAINSARMERDARTWRPGMPVWRPPMPLWWSYLGGDARTLFQRVRQIEHQSHEVLIDSDALCACQDDAAIRITSLMIERVANGRAQADVHFDFGAQSREQNELRILLAHGEGGWRIVEITHPDGSTFTSELRQSLASYDAQARGGRTR